jgi:hypothetical protein
MAQSPGVRSSLALSYVTSMARPDAALALAAIHGFERRQQARRGAICVSGSGLEAAIYCDIVERLYAAGPPRGSNDVLPIGLDLVTPLPADPPMVRGVVERRNDKGEPAYPRSIRKVTDTALAEAVLRNGVSLSREVAFVLSAPAGPLARALDLQGVKELFAARVKHLVIVDRGEAQSDVPSLRKVLREWPSPVVLCGKEVGESLAFPAASLASGFAWSGAHPVVDAYRSYKAMPYDAPSHDLAAMHYVARPESGFFALAAGTVTVSGAGRLTFTPGGGTAASLSVEPAMREALLRDLIAVATANPQSAA